MSGGIQRGRDEAAAEDAREGLERCGPGMRRDARRIAAEPRSREEERPDESVRREREGRRQVRVERRRGGGRVGDPDAATGAPEALQEERGREVPEEEEARVAPRALGEADVVARDREEQRRAQSLTAAEHLRGEPPERRDRRDAEQDGRQPQRPRALPERRDRRLRREAEEHVVVELGARPDEELPAGSRTYFTSVTISSYERHEPRLIRRRTRPSAHEAREHEPRAASRCAARRVVHRARSGPQPFSEGGAPTSPRCARRRRRSAPTGTSRARPASAVGESLPRAGKRFLSR